MEKPKTVLGVLKAARKLIDHPSKWTKQALARASKRGRQVVSGSGEARCFCSVGALSVATEDYTLHGRLFVAARRAIDKVAYENSGRSVISFNDHPTTRHRDIMRLFDKAIARLEAKR